MPSNIDSIATWVCITMFVIRTIYEFLKHYKVIVPNRVSFVIICLVMFSLWPSWFMLGSGGHDSMRFPAIVSYLGAVVVASGVIIFIVALLTIKSLESYEGDLVSKGVYSRIRHPMYLGFILWIVGRVLYSGSGRALVLSVPFILLILLWRHLEEKELVRRFDGYGEYRKRTYF